VVGYRILVVDDEAEICKILSLFLKKKGFDVLAAGSGEEALAILGKERVDLMILDKKMPGIGGLAVLSELKKRKAGTPVIVLTGSMDFSEETAIELDCAAVLNKPIDLTVLLERIEETLKGV
jgi:two-component system response regulator GlrR